MKLGFEWIANSFSDLKLKMKCSSRRQNVNGIILRYAALLIRFGPFRGLWKQTHENGSNDAN